MTTKDQCTLLGGILVNWIVEQQLKELTFCSFMKNMKISKRNIKYTTFQLDTIQHVPWLILELEMNITIREIQINVARHMMQPKWTVRQMMTVKI